MQEIVNGVPVDAKGRPEVQSMTERELLEETVLKLREGEDAVTELMNKFGKHPMLRAMGL